MRGKMRKNRDVFGVDNPLKNVRDFPDLDRQIFLLFDDGLNCGDDLYSAETLELLDFVIPGMRNLAVAQISRRDRSANRRRSRAMRSGSGRQVASGSAGLGGCGWLG